MATLKQNVPYHEHINVKGLSFTSYKTSILKVNIQMTINKIAIITSLGCQLASHIRSQSYIEKLICMHDIMNAMHY